MRTEEKGRIGLRLKPFCTCGSTDNLHYLACDLQYRDNTFPRRKKRFFFFYPRRAPKGAYPKRRTKYTRRTHHG